MIRRVFVSVAALLVMFGSVGTAWANSITTDNADISSYYDVGIHPMQGDAGLEMVVGARSEEYLPNDYVRISAPGMTITPTGNRILDVETCNGNTPSGMTETKTTVPAVQPQRRSTLYYNAAPPATTGNSASYVEEFYTLKAPGPFRGNISVTFSGVRGTETYTVPVSLAAPQDTAAGLTGNQKWVKMNTQEQIAATPSATSGKTSWWLPIAGLVVVLAASGWIEVRRREKNSRM